MSRAGFIGGIDRFDPLFFGISPREARWMDPRQRLLMRTVWAALEDAGMDPGDLAGSDTGLFVGVGSSEYAELIQRSGAATDAYSSTGLAPSMLANRISYQLDLHGPSEPVDTACSSSLVALHRAAEALRLGRCGTVIVGGVSLMLSPVTFASLERAGMLSPDGVGRAFDADAAGYVRGEGVGAVVLKRLSRARADGNPILAVLRGTAVNHGGRANSLTAPNPRAQADVIRQAHREAAVDPATIGYLETHGTGTVIGDPAETNGLREAFADLYQDWGHDAPDKPHCALGALKNTIGHLEPAAGIAAVLRVLLSMRHGRISGDPHGPRPNPHLGLEGTPFELATGPREWAPPAPGVPRRAGVSAFGYGGVNAHVVLEEYPAEEPIPAPGPVVFVLSARDPERLRAYVRSFADRPDRWAHDLVGTAYTLQTGRGASPSGWRSSPTPPNTPSPRCDASSLVTPSACTPGGSSGTRTALRTTAEATRRPQPPGPEAHRWTGIAGGPPRRAGGRCRPTRSRRNGTGSPTARLPGRSVASRRPGRTSRSRRPASTRAGCWSWAIYRCPARCTSAPARSTATRAR